MGQEQFVTLYQILMEMEEELGAEYARQHRLSVFKETKREKEEMLEGSLPTHPAPKLGAPGQAKSED